VILGDDVHAPDGFLDVGTAVATGAVSAGTIGVAVRRSRDQLADTQVPLAGISAAFIFAAQMVNFPVAGGTSGHLLGGALAAILLGPAVGSVAVGVVVLVQALIFADGGLTALGYNVLNMAIVTSFGGYAIFRGLLRLLPRTGTTVVFASGIAAGLSVVLSSAAFSLEWLFGATFPVPFDTVFGAMVGAHLLIGVGEAVITGTAIGAVLAARPDLVHGAHDLDRAALRDRRPIGLREVAMAGLFAALLIATVASQFAVSTPDGLERVAADTGFAAAAGEHAVASGLFADYATAGLGNETVSLAVAGASGVAITLLVGSGLFAAVRGRRPDGPDASSTAT
jgi:cobalt/nickel transport system permease protein